MSDADGEISSEGVMSNDQGIGEAAPRPPPKGWGKAGRVQKPGLNLVKQHLKLRGRIVDGKKLCDPCGKWLDVAAFPAGSSMCADHWKAFRAMKHAVHREGQMACWEEFSKDPEKLIKMRKAFREFSISGQKGQTHEALYEV